jgi:2-dehydro-3-deoxyglucarate aldolase/4-hydroxy-2-oxoheptanedioate aldolase
MKFINNVDRFRQRMLEGRICVGPSISLSDPILSELAAETGSDLVWYEMEHSCLDIRSLASHLMALRGTQAASVVRVSWNDPVIIKPILDLAPAAIVVPMVRTGEEARQAVRACRYPPNGERGFGPMRNMYGLGSMQEYLDIAAQQIMVFVQVEHVEAVHNLDAILATEGLDGVVLGRNDLTGSMGKLGQHSDPEVLEVIDTVFIKTRQTDRFLGVSIGADVETVRDWYRKGVQWFGLGDDTDYFFEGAKAVADASHALDGECE